MSKLKIQDPLNSHAQRPHSGKGPTLVVPKQAADSRVVFLGKPRRKYGALKLVALIMIAGLIPGFVLGAWVVAFRVPPYGLARDFYWNRVTQLESLLRNQSKYESIPEEYRQTNADSLIRIKSMDDVIAKRKALQTLVWGQEGLPLKSQPSVIQYGIFDPRYSDLKNLKSIDKIVVSMDRGVESTAYHFRPKSEAKTVIIYHEGHLGDFAHGKRAIDYLLRQGYPVVALSMPLLGMNNQPKVFIENVGFLRLVSHDHLKFLDRPLAPFLEPVCVILNYLQKRFQYRRYGYDGLFRRRMDHANVQRYRHQNFKELPNQRVFAHSFDITSQLRSGRWILGRL